VLLQQCSPGVVASGILGDAAKVSLLGTRGDCGYVLTGAGLLI